MNLEPNVFTEDSPLSEAEWLQRAFDLSPEEAARNLRAQDWYEKLSEQERFAELPGWAGAWIDHRNGGTIHLLGSDDATVKFLSGFQGEVPVVAERRDYPIADLIGLADEIGASLPDFPPDETGRVVRQASTTVSIIDNAIHLSVEIGSEAEKAVERFAKDPRVQLSRVEAVDDMQGAACPLSECDSARGGMRLWPSDNTGEVCTHGFVFRKNDLTYGSTAGHCGNETWSHPQTANWSNPALEDYGDTYDATLRVDQNNGYDLQITTIHDRDKWKASNVIWRPSDGLYDITDQVNTPATSLLGHSVCAIGVGKIHYLGYAGETCGTLTAVYSDGFGVANMRICEGDSGGPVFGPTLNKAWGLMMGYPVGEGGVHCNAEASSRHAFFTWISKVESSSGFQVMLSP